ncbi:MAG: MoaF N-terminal domain-containing protein [Candidatus Competibacterales bacterium]
MYKTQLMGRIVEYRIGEYHLRIEFLDEEQLRWTYLAAPEGQSGKTATERHERSDIRDDVVMLRWTEADGTQVVDVFDFGDQRVYANFVIEGQRYSVEGEMSAVAQ